MKCSVCSFELGHTYTPKNCPQCQGRKNRDKVERMREVVRELKEGVRYDLDSARESELRRLLVEYGHPDPTGLLAWIADQRANPNKAKQQRRFA